MDNTLKDITKVLSAGGLAISSLSFAEGLLLHSFNGSAFLAFCATWLILNALSEQIDSESRKLLVSLGVPTSVASLAIAFLLFAMP